MKQEFSTVGRIEDTAALMILDKRRMNDFLKANTGQDVVLEMRVIKRHSSKLNAYFYGVVVPYAKHGFEDLGERYTKDQVIDELKKQSPVTNTPICDSDGVVERYRSIGELGGNEMSEFIEDLNRFCATELHIVLPDPNQYK